MRPEAFQKVRVISVWVLKIILGLVFFVVGISKLTATLQTEQFFAAIGWGQWFRYLTGVVDLVAAVLLFMPQWTFYGSILLTCSVGSATLICLLLLHQNAAVPLAFTLLAATLMWLTRPRPLR